ncbi:hypothetical protein [Methylosinus sp. Sm6]|uniref:hypothetical protein n=1 Tax=Methylosinus sp. Sm6 TaxID=2866948 RepID=UPI001C9904F8|nr:hypothetical protein [Methylosinus sp. Sm6]MBY6242930.1 hypothetical protein [Methylosinus sp. Sm6]
MCSPAQPSVSRTGIFRGMGAIALHIIQEDTPMRDCCFVAAIAAAASLAACVAASPAMALGAVTYVSGKGVNSGVCATPATACRTFGYAIGQTSAAGEIKALDPANYGALTIDKSITITGVPGTSVRTANAKNAVAINAANAIVTLRGIDIDGGGVGTAGVVAYYARVLNIVGCVVRRFANEGVAISGGWDGMSVTISDTISSNNGKFGVDIVPGQKPVVASMDHVTTNDNGVAGLRAYPGAIVTIVDSFANNNASVGYLAVGGFPNATTMRLGRSAATGNQVGIQNLNFATVQSFGDNAVLGNATDISGVVASISHK